jgi:hypothetical protein
LWRKYTEHKVCCTNFVSNIFSLVNIKRHICRKACRYSHENVVKDVRSNWKFKRFGSYSYILQYYNLFSGSRTVSYRSTDGLRKLDRRSARSTTLGCVLCCGADDIRSNAINILTHWNNMTSVTHRLFGCYLLWRLWNLRATHMSLS